MLGWIPGVDVITVNPGWFADNYMAVLESVSQFGLMALPLGNGLNAPPSNEDIARVVVGALTHPEPHVGRTYRPTGPRLLAPDEIAFIFGKILGRAVKYQDAPLALFLKVAKSMGISDFVITQLYYFLQDYRRNSFGLGAPTSAVLEVAGAQPEDFETIARRYIAGSRFTRRTAGSLLSALGNIAKGFATPMPRLDAIARRMELPHIAHATLAADSREWLALHSPVPGR